jgi:hypothetical protein
MAKDDSPVGYKNPPGHGRFQKGQSGNPHGRPKKVPDFMEDAAEILGGTVTGQAKGKSITLSITQAMFRRQCRQALEGDNQALRRLIDLMLTLEPAARDKANEKTTTDQDLVRKFNRLTGIDSIKIDDIPKEPDSKRKEREKRVDAIVKKERQRLIREARRSQGRGPTGQ